jgi:hypothetical protein
LWDGARLTDFESIVIALGGAAAAGSKPSEQDLAAARKHAARLSPGYLDGVLDRARATALDIVEREAPQIDALVEKLRRNGGRLRGRELDEFFERDREANMPRNDMVIPPGGKVTVSLEVMDELQRSVFADSQLRAGKPLVVDGAGHAAGHRPGYLFDGVGADTHRQAADTAYQERVTRMAGAWRGDREHHDDDRRGSPPSLKDAQAAAERAHAERVARMRDAWRQR